MRVYLNQTEDVPGSKLLINWENAAEDGSFAFFFNAFEVSQRREHKDHMKPIGGRLRRWEQASWGNLWLLFEK